MDKGKAMERVDAERQAEEAERTVDAQKQTEFMQDKIGEVFEGTISGVTPNGFFVELDNTIEGFVSVNRLPKGRYEYNESRYMLAGMGQTYKIGARIEVRVVAVDVVLRRIDFELSNFHREDSDVESFEKNDRFERRQNERNHQDYGERRGRRSNRKNRR